MPKYLNIQIRNGCHQDWQKMTPDEQGRFCNSCQKTVVDFSLMTDEQLTDFFKNNKTDLCGRFYTDQLNKDLVIPPKKIPFLKYFFQISIPAFLFSLKAAAQTTKVRPGISFFETKKIIDQFQKAHDILRTITGVITNSKGEPIEGASVVIRNSNRGVMADSLGRFMIDLKKDENILEISAIGYSTTILHPNQNNLTVVLDDRYTNVTVGIIVTSTRRIKSKPIKTKPATTNNQTQASLFSIYPNPVALYGNLNIKWEKPVDADQLVEIFDASGALVQRENISVQDKLSKQNIYLRMLRTGMYVIKITDSKSHKFQSSNFIVE